MRLQARATNRQAAFRRNSLGTCGHEDLLAGALGKMVSWVGFEPGPIVGGGFTPWLEFEHGSGGRRPGLPLEWVGDKERVILGVVCGGLAEYMDKVV